MASSLSSAASSAPPTLPLGDGAAAGGGAVDVVGFYLMADGGSNVDYWSGRLSGLNATGRSFLAHLGSATREVDGCDRPSYVRARESMGSSSVPVYATPGDNDYPRCDDPSRGWEMYEEHVSRIDEGGPWGRPTEYVVRRQGSRGENFSFLLGRVLFVGLNMVSNVADGE